ncbi:MAG: signal transduction histidine kinase [Phenylobacterium sp.]|jgi:signal transduction histidine kinase
MEPQTTQTYSLRRRIIWQFCLFSLFLSVLFSCYNFFFMYVMEDVFIERTIVEEAEYLKRGYLKTGEWPTPRKNHMVLHHSMDSFPDDVKAVFLREPNRREFYGFEERHYHLYPMDKVGDRPVSYLMGEVSQLLVVRPMRTLVMSILSVSSVLMTLLACFIGYRLAKRTIKPLSDLVRLVDGVDPTHLPKKFAERYPPNEIGILATTLEHSMQRINDFVAREQHFTRDASHELRTPIAVIKNATELLVCEADLNVRTQPLLMRISRASLQMEQTVNTLLSLAREEKEGDEVEAIRLLPVVEKAVVQHAYLLDGKPVEVNVDIGVSATVTLPIGILQILVANLISNAFQYTLAGEVTMNFEQQCFKVFDTGPGIEADIKDNLLEPMVKGSDSQGFGIGLSIVKRLCEHHGLTLMIESQPTSGVVVSIKL